VRPSRIHRRSSAARLLALVLLVVGWGMPLAFPHLADDDLLCAAGESQGTGDAPQVSGSGSAPAEHCAVCHLQRTFRSGDLDAAPDAVALDSAPLRLPGAQPHPLRPSRHRLPARAPPA
jgi:hypothetical protein